MSANTRKKTYFGNLCRNGQGLRRWGGGGEETLVKVSRFTYEYNMICYFY